MMTLFCNEDKYLSVVNDTADSYETENGAIKVTVNFVPICCGYSIADSKIDLCVSTPEGKIYVLNINDPDDDRNVLSLSDDKSYYTATEWLTANHTSAPGTIKIWLEITSNEDGVMMKSNAVTKANYFHNMTSPPHCHHGHGGHGGNIDAIAMQAHKAAAEAEVSALRATDSASKLEQTLKISEEYVKQLFASVAVRESYVENGELVLVMTDGSVLRSGKLPVWGTF